MAYASPPIQVFTVQSVTATTATLTSTKRRPGVNTEWPSQVVITWPTARPVEFAAGAEFLIPVTSR